MTEVLSSGEVCGNAWMSDTNQVSAEATEARSIGTVGMRLRKMVTVSGDDMKLGIGVCNYALLQLLQWLYLLLDWSLHLSWTSS